MDMFYGTLVQTARYVASSIMASQFDMDMCYRYLIQFRLVKKNISDILNYILPIHNCHFRNRERRSS